MPSPPTLLLLDQFAGLGGGQRALLDLLPALNDRFHPVLAVPAPGPLSQQVSALGVHCEFFSLDEYSLGHKTAADLLRYALRQPALIARISQIARQYDADLLYANGPRLFPASAVVARRDGIPLIWHLHSELPSLRDRRLVQVAARAGRPTVIACSDACVASFPPTSVVRRHAVVVHNGVAEIEVPAPSAADGRVVIGTVGRIHPDKGQATLLRAAPEILRVCPGACFRLVGPQADAAYAEELHRMAAALPDCVEFTGEALSPGHALSGLDVLVVPSNRESFGRVILEAFSAGIPVVTSDAGGIPEIVSPEKDSLMFRRGNAGELAAVVIRILRDSGLRRHLLLNARRNYRQRWRVERFQREIVRLVEARLERQQATRSSRAR